jgi:hypothetical protein
MVELSSSVDEELSSLKLSSTFISSDSSSELSDEDDEDDDEDKVEDEIDDGSSLLLSFSSVSLYLS